MKHVVDGESAAIDGGANELSSGVRDASGTQTLDPPTEEIDIEPAEPATTVRAVSAAPSPTASIARPTSIPPPLPTDALRVRSVAMPPGVPPPVPEAAQLQAELERVSKRMRERDAYVAELEALYAQRSDGLRKALAQIEALESRVAELEARLAATPPSAAGDDLTRIRGIGPRFAQALAALGSGSFAAIAAWTSEEIAVVGRQLKVPAGRIERDRWVEQARDLADRAADRSK